VTSGNTAHALSGVIGVKCTNMYRAILIWRPERDLLLVIYETVRVQFSW